MIRLREGWRPWLGVSTLAAGIWCAGSSAPLPAAAQRATGSAQSPAVQTVRFENVAAQAGLDFRHVNGASADRHLYEIMGSGGLFFDYDNDGWVDIFLVDGGSLTDPAIDRMARHRLYRNRGDGTFEDVTTRSGIPRTGSAPHTPAHGMGVCAADYDNDGWMDLYVTNVGPNVLYRNNGNGTFTDVTASAGVAGPPVFSASCAFADIDGNGFVDLFVTNYVDARVDNNIFCGDATKPLRIYCHPVNFAPLADVLFRNNGNGTFTDTSGPSGVAAQRGNGLGVVFGDYDDDGRPDLFVANDAVPDFLYHNEGKGVFKETGLLAGVSVASDGRARAGMGTDFGDYDGDGRLDLFVTNHELETHTLFQNLGGGLFADVTFPSGLGVPTLPFVGFGTLFFDYDSDGRLDLAIVNGHVMNSSGHFRPGATDAQRNLLFHNQGAGRFAEVGERAGPGFAIEKISRALAAGDIDNDGNLDLLITNNGGAVDLLRNTGGHGNNGLLVRLVGTRSNRNAIGARLLVTAGGTIQVRELKAGSSYLSQHDLRVHVGVGRASRIDRLEIHWPAGQTEVLESVPVNQIVTVVEGRGITELSDFQRR
jgi:enediyne biosynthesis protein E4